MQNIFIADPNIAERWCKNMLSLQTRPTMPISRLAWDRRCLAGAGAPPPGPGSPPPPPSRAGTGSRRRSAARSQTATPASSRTPPPRCWGGTGICRCIFEFVIHSDISGDLWDMSCLRLISIYPKCQLYLFITNLKVAFIFISCWSTDHMKIPGCIDKMWAQKLPRKSTIYLKFIYF